jgi:short-subunit dehydrogenase
MAAERSSLCGKHVVITGASSGLGAALAVEMASLGAHVTLLARRQKLLDGVATQIRAQGGDALALATDVTVQESVDKAIVQAVEHWGPVDILVANAGGSPNMAASDVDVSLVEDTMQLNFFGIVYPTNAVLPAMIERKDGIVLAISSVAAFRGLPTMGPYCASKAAVSAWMESLRSELDLQKTGVRLITSHPGFIRTPMTKDGESRMPFIVEADDAARRLVQGIVGGESTINFPWQFVAMMKFAGRLPNRMYDRVVWGATTNPVTWSVAVRAALLWLCGGLTVCLIAVLSMRAVAPTTAQTIKVICQIMFPVLTIAMLVVSKRLGGSIKIPILIVLFSIPPAIIAGLAKLIGLFYSV